MNFFKDKILIKVNLNGKCNKKKKQGAFKFN